MLIKIIQTFLFRFSSSVITFLIVLITARILGAEARGYISLLMATITIIIMLNNFVGGPSLVYLVPRLSAHDILKISYLWGLFICIAGSFVISLFSLIPGWMGIHVFALSLLQSIVSIHQFFLQGKNDIKSANLIAFIQPCVQLLYVMAVCCLNTLTVLQIIYSMYASFIISVVVSLYVLRKYLKIKTSPLPSPKPVLIFQEEMELKKNGLSIVKVNIFTNILSYGFVNQLANISQLISYRISYYFINILAGTSILGIFSTGTSIAESIWLIGGSISLVQYANIANTNDKKHAIGSTITLLKWSGITTLLALFVLNYIPSTFYVAIFGNEFSEIKNVLLWLSPGIFAMGLGMIISHFFSGTGRYYINAIASGSGMLFSLATAYFFINNYQLLGACIITSISYIITTILLFIYFIREAGASHFATSNPQL